MECERVREEFVEQLTGTLDAGRGAAIDRHLADCVACRTETHRLRELWTELGSLRVPPASGAAGRVSRLVDARMLGGTSQAGTAGASRRPLAPRVTLGTLALAASLLAGVAIGSRTRSTVPAAESSTSPAAPAPGATAVRDRYVLLLHGPARPGASGAPPTAADLAAEQAIVAEYRAWAMRLRDAGTLVLAEKLADDPFTWLTPAGAVNVQRNTAEELGGFFVIQADSAEAYRIARECPHLRHGGTVQVRRIQPT